MKSFAAVIAVAVFGVAGHCRADEQAATPPSGAVGAPSRPLKAVLSDFVGNQFVGSVVWHTDNVAQTGHPPVFAVRADIEIPDLGMAVRLDLRRNEDASLAASHTVELVFTLPSDFPHGEIGNVPGLLMKADETVRGDALKGVSVNVATNFFLFGLSSAEADRQRNIRLIEERSWIDVPIAYSNGKRVDIVVEKAPFGERAVAVLGLPAAGLMTLGQSGDGPAASPAPGNAAFSAARLNEAVRQKLNIAVLARPLWSWPPLPVWWSWMPRSLTGRWTWQLWGQTALPGSTVRFASTTVPTLAPRPPSWLQSMSAVTVATTAVPPWPRVRAPDFHIPSGRSRFAGEKNLEPPARFVRWSDRIETVMPPDEVGRRCRAVLGRPPVLGNVYRGCSRGVVGRCLIVRIDDPGVARHELAHCNGWRHPE
jgi:hypothetical protein